MPMPRAMSSAPLFTYEGVVAFFLESGFLGIMLFGRKRVPPLAHFFSAVMVAAGTLFSAFWILAANSWMQTPVGHEIVDGRFVPARLACGDLQPVVPLPLRAHGDRLLPDDGLRRTRRDRVAPEARAPRRGGA